MSTPIFISPHARVLDAWRSAFADLSSVASPAALPAEWGESLLWLDAARDTWASEVRTLAARGSHSTPKQAAMTSRPCSQLPMSEKRVPPATHVRNSDSTFG